LDDEGSDLINGQPLHNQGVESIDSSVDEFGVDKNTTGGT
jgi:hypothetical protein